MNRYTKPSLLQTNIVVTGYDEKYFDASKGLDISVSHDTLSNV